MALPFKILETDLRYTNSPEEPQSECSRCRKPIDEEEVPIMAWPESGRYIYRFHPECLGFATSRDYDGDS